MLFKFASFLFKTDSGYRKFITYVSDTFCRPSSIDTANTWQIAAVKYLIISRLFEFHCFIVPFDRSLTARPTAKKYLNDVV